MKWRINANAVLETRRQLGTAAEIWEFLYPIAIVHACSIFVNSNRGAA